MSDDLVARLVAAVRPVDADAYEQALLRQGALAKPPGSLGRLEELSAQLAAISRACPPPVPSAPALLIAAGDHGVHARGVSMWPQELSTAVAAGCTGGTAVAAVLAARQGVRLVLLDAGLVTPLPPSPNVRERAAVRGTRDLVAQDAMTSPEVLAAVQAGADVAAELVADGADLLLLGEVGIGNTTAAACLTACLTGAPAEAVTGRGAGADDAALQRKTEVVRLAVARVAGRRDPLALLAAVGGAEHAALTGTVLQAAAAGVPVLLDGVSTTAASLAAVALCPDARGYLLASHRSPEPAASVALERLGLAPLLELYLRLGEGSGALLALPLVQSAAAVLRDTGLISRL